MNKTLHAWLCHFGNSTIAAAYWMGIDEDTFIDLLGFEELDQKIDETLKAKMSIILPEENEVEALKSVIIDQDQKLSYAAQAANNFLVGLTDHHIKLKELT